MQAIISTRDRRHDTRTVNSGRRVAGGNGTRHRPRPPRRPARDVTTAETRTTSTNSAAGSQPKRSSGTAAVYYRASPCATAPTAPWRSRGRRCCGRSCQICRSAGWPAPIATWTCRRPGCSAATAEACSAGSRTTSSGRNRAQARFILGSIAVVQNRAEQLRLASTACSAGPRRRTAHTAPELGRRRVLTHHVRLPGSRGTR